MKTSVNNGLNISSLSWDYFITLNRIIPTSVSKWETEIEKIMDDNDFNQMYWSCEKTKNVKGTYHIHLLVDTSKGQNSHQELLTYFTNYLVNGKEVSYKSNYTTSTPVHQIKEYDGKKIIYDTNTNENKRLIEYKKTRTLIGSNNQTIQQEVIERVFIPFHEIRGRDGRGYIERIKGVRNTSLYINKFNDWGINNKYLKK